MSSDSTIQTREIKITTIVSVQDGILEDAWTYLTTDKAGIEDEFKRRSGFTQSEYKKLTNCEREKNDVQVFEQKIIIAREHHIGNFDERPDLIRYIRNQIAKEYHYMNNSVTVREKSIREKNIRMLEMILIEMGVTR